MGMSQGLAAYGRGAGAYAKVGVESGVMNASPHRLIEMLFDGLQMNLRKARLAMEQNNTVVKGQAISRSLDIINGGLLAALDTERGGEIAQGLSLIYDYCGRLLLEANLRNDLAKLDEAVRLLSEIGAAWQDVGKNAQATAQEAAHV